MEKTIELQKEFEALIAQLGKLKSINELTSENSQRAEEVVQVVSDLTSKLSKFRDSIGDDYEEKKEKFDATIIHFDQSIISVKEKFEKEVKQHNNELKEINKKSNTEVAAIQNELFKQVDNFENQLKASTETAEIHFGELRKANAKSIEQNFSLVKEDIKRVSNSVELLEYDMSKKLDKSRREIKDLKKVIIAVGVLLFVALVALKFV